MELLLIRHGLPERVVNEDGTPADPPLSAKGRDQAERVARWLEGVSIDRLYSSPLLRARETAQPLAALRGLPVEIEPGVREYDADSALYIPMEDLKEHDYEQWKVLVSGGYAAEVDFLAFRGEVVTGVEQIIADNPGRRVVVFCHGGVINAWAGYVLGIGNPMFFEPAYTSIHRTLISSAGPRTLVSLNESGHLVGTR